MSLCNDSGCPYGGLHEFNRSRSTKCIKCGCADNKTPCYVTDRCPEGGVHTVSRNEFRICAKCGCHLTTGGRKTYRFKRTRKTRRTKTRRTKTRRTRTRRTK